MDDERSTFGELVNTYQKRVFQVALSMLGDKEGALDITQEVFVKAFKAYKNFRFNASPETWLIKITINKVRDYLRKERLRRLFFLKPGTLSDGQINMIAGNNQSPHEILREKQLQSSLNSFQRGLKGREKEVFALRFGAGYTIKEISEFTGISQSSIKTYLYRALDKAQKYLSDWNMP